MKFLFYIFLFSLNFSCNGQEKYPEKTGVKSNISELKIYKSQKEQIEFINYQMYVNGNLIRLQSIRNFSKIIGKPDFVDYGNLIYYSSSINPSAHISQKVDQYNQPLILVGNKELPLRDSKGSRLEKKP